MASYATGSPAMSDGGLTTYRGFMDKFESVTSGRTFPDGGLKSGARWEIPYEARTIPKAYEDYMATAAMTGAKPRVNITLSEQDKAAMREKVDMMEMADLHRRFFESMRPFDDPVRFMILRKIYPEPFDAIIKALEKRSDVQKDIYKKMLGDPTKESILMMMALADSPEAQSIVKEAVGPKKGVGADKDAKVAEWDLNGIAGSQFKRGMFSAHRLTELSRMFEFGHMFHPANPAGASRIRRPGQMNTMGLGQSDDIVGYDLPTGLPDAAGGRRPKQPYNTAIGQSGMPFAYMFDAFGIQGPAAP